MNTKARVLLVDDLPLYREGLRELFGRWDDFEVVAEASNGKEAIDACKKNDIDLVLMDVHMPVMNGIEAASVICREFPHTYVVMLTVASDDDTVFAALSCGVRGYLLKDIHTRQLHDRLRGVMRGEAALSGSIAAKVLKDFNSRHALSGTRVAVDACLSEREIKLLSLLARGLSNEDIGEQLFVSTGTVKKMMSMLLLNLNCENRVQLAVYAVKHGLG